MQHLDGGSQGYKPIVASPSNSPARRRLPPDTLTAGGEQLLDRLLNDDDARRAERASLFHASSGPRSVNKLSVVVSMVPGKQMRRVQRTIR